MPGAKAPEEERREQILEAARTVAGRETLAGLTIRRVADEAGLSNGLVLFHFKSKELLLMALLERLLEQTVGESERALEECAHPDPREAFRSYLRREIERLPRERERVELFFDYWVMGTRSPEIRSRVRGALERYRQRISALTASLLSTLPAPPGGMTSEGMAAVAVSFIEGCALQAVIDPARFDLELYLQNVDALLDRVVG